MKKWGHRGTVTQQVAETEGEEGTLHTQMTPHMTYLVCLGVVADSPWMITQRRDIDGEKELLII